MIWPDQETAEQGDARGSLEFWAQSHWHCKTSLQQTPFCLLCFPSCPSPVPNTDSAQGWTAYTWTLNVRVSSLCTPGSTRCKLSSAGQGISTCHICCEAPGQHFSCKWQSSGTCAGQLFLIHRSLNTHSLSQNGDCSCCRRRSSQMRRQSGEKIRRNMVNLWLLMQSVSREKTNSMKN